MTRFVIPSWFYGLFIGLYAIGLKYVFVDKNYTKRRLRPFYAKLNTLNKCYGCGFGGKAYLLRRDKGPTNKAIAKALADLALVNSGVTINDVIKADSGFAVSDANYKLAKKYLNGDLKLSSFRKAEAVETKADYSQSLPTTYASTLKEEFLKKIILDRPLSRRASKSTQISMRSIARRRGEYYLKNIDPELAKQEADERKAEAERKAEIKAKEHALTNSLLREGFEHENIYNIKVTTPGSGFGVAAELDPMELKRALDAGFQLIKDKE